MEFEYPNILVGSYLVRLSLAILVVLNTFLLIGFLLKKSNIKRKDNDIISLLTSCFFFIIIPIYIMLVPIHEIDTSLFSPILKFMLQIEPLIIIGAIFAALIGIYFRNKYTYYNAIKPILLFSFYAMNFSIFALHKANLFEWYNIIYYVYACFCFCAINIFDFSYENPSIEPIIRTQHSEIITSENKAHHEYAGFNPITTYNQLFSNRISQADAILELITIPNEWADDGFSICISGEWGSGKTSLINGVINKLEDKNKGYHVIRINSLDISSKDSLFAYYYSQLKNILNKERAYIGISSEISAFISSAIGIVTNADITNIFSQLFRNSQTDYLKNKTELEKLINNVMGNNKIIVVVDDVERCSKESANEIIKFTKELVSNKKIVAIFLIDNEQFIKLHKNELSEIEIKDVNLYYDKFFNYRFILTELTIEEIWKGIKVNETFKDDKKAPVCLFEIVTKIILHITEAVDSFKRSYKNDTENETMKKYVDLFSNTYDFFA